MYADVMYQFGQIFILFRHVVKNGNVFSLPAREMTKAKHKLQWKRNNTV